MIRHQRTSKAKLILTLAFCAAVNWAAVRLNAEDAVVVSHGAVASPATAPKTPDQILQALLEGNERFVTGQLARPHQTADYRLGLTRGQNPVAIILTCADSRVVPELYFDQGLGDLFVLRNAGNILDDHILGSMEYAIEHLHVRLVVVVGHASCGAVSAAVAGGEAGGHVHSVLEAISPAVAATQGQAGDRIDNVVRAHAQAVARTLEHVEPVLKPAALEGRIKIVAARYDLATGKIDLLK